VLWDLAYGFSALRRLTGDDRPRASPSALSQRVALGLPFVIGGGIESIDEVTLWRWFRNVPLLEPVKEPA
jgi:hypothetical protein